MYSILELGVHWQSVIPLKGVTLLLGDRDWILERVDLAGRGGVVWRRDLDKHLPRPAPEH